MVIGENHKADIREPALVLSLFQEKRQEGTGHHNHKASTEYREGASIISTM